MPIKIDFISNVRDFIRGTDDVERALDDTADSLDDLARDGDQALGRLDRSFRDLSRNTSDVDKLGDTGSKSFRKLGDTGEEVSGELKQNLGETFSSFRGDMEDLPQIAQDTLGGLAGSGALGGIAGLAATAAGAAGIGLIIGALDTANERAEALKERATNMAQTMIEAGNKTISAMDIAGRTSEILTGDEREEAEEYARVLGVDIPTAARAMAGDMNALAVVNRIASQAQQENLDIAENQKGSTEALTAAQQEAVKANQDMIAKGKELNGVVEDANLTFEEQQAVLRGLINDADEATTATDDLGNQIYELPDGTTIVIDAETGHASTNVANFDGDLDKLGRKIVNPTVKVSVDASAWNNWVPQTKVGQIITGTAGVGGKFWE